MNPATLYGSVLRVPGAARFSAAAAIARFPAPMLGVGLVLMVEAATGSFAAAGRVCAVLVASQALATPLLARLVDRSGQRRVLVPALVATTAGMTGLGIGGLLHSPEPVLWGLAVLCGAGQGSYGSYVRARWTHVLGGDRRIHTAFSLEAAIDEFTFVVGPVVATLLATAVIPPGPLFFGAVAGAVGGTLFLTQRATEPPVAPPGQPAVAARGSVLRMPGVGVTALLFVGVGAIFGSADVATVAFAQERGRPGAAGVMLGCFALGSMVAGLAYGARTWVRPVSVRFVAGTVALASGVSLFSLTQSLPQLAAALVLAGLAVSPTVICGNALVQGLVPRERLTEGLAWLSTSMMAGISLGSWIGGWQVDEAGARGGYVVTLAVGWCCAGIALLALRHLRAARRAEPLTDDLVTAPLNPSSTTTGGTHS